MLTLEDNDEDWYEYKGYVQETQDVLDCRASKCTTDTGSNKEYVRFEDDSSRLMKVGSGISSH